MKIRRITATPINLPLEAPYIWVFGELPGFSVTIVEVETEDGLVGLGEAPSWLAASDGPFRPRNNVVSVPEGHGLGVKLDRERLSQCHRDFLDHGPMNKYHDAANPGTFRRLPLI